MNELCLIHDYAMLHISMSHVCAIVQVYAVMPMPLCIAKAASVLFVSVCAMYVYAATTGAMYVYAATTGSLVALHVEYHVM